MRNHSPVSFGSLSTGITGFSVLALSLIGQCGCSHSPTQAEPSGGQPGPRTVGVVNVKQGDAVHTMTQPATVQGGQEAALYAKTSGYLRAIYVDKGDRVRAGQVLAVIESPELQAQQGQAMATYNQSRAAARGATAARGRAVADVAQAGAGVERAASDERQAAAVVARAGADLARSRAQIPKFEALVREADSTVQQADEQQGQAEADIRRWQQQAKASQAAVRAAASNVAKAQSDFRLQQLTYQRLKAIQDKDSGLIAAQDVDVAEARMRSSQSEVENAASKLESATQDAGTVEQQVEEARRAATAALRKREAAKSHADAARDDLQIARRDIASSSQQVKVAQAQRESAGAQVHVAQSQWRALRAQIGIANAQIDASQYQSVGNRNAAAAATALASYSRIVAPFDGVVTERLADAGSFVQNAGNNQASARPLLKIVQDRILRVLVPVPESDVRHVQDGQPASIVMDGYPKEILRGTITRNASAVDPRSRTMLAEIDIPNPGGRFRPGMYARVTLTLEVHRGALSIPSEAVMGKEDNRSVYVVDGGRAHKTPVMVGADDGKTAEITQGLRPGLQVVVDGRDSLVNNAPVKVIPAKIVSPVK